MRIETNKIYIDLQQKLETVFFTPGEKLKPSELQGLYDCSANTVRDVLLRLSNAGLVEFEIQKGFRARESSLELRRDVTRFRIILEQEGAALSMLNGGVRWEARLSASHHKLSHIESQIERCDKVKPFLDLWSDAEKEFHETLISSCGSPILLETYRNTYAQFRQQMISQEPEFGTLFCHEIIKEHQSILDAALARDVDACRLAIADHLKRNL